jgi:hypothetical protein
MYENLNKYKKKTPMKVDKFRINQLNRNYYFNFLPGLGVTLEGQASL